MLQRNTGPPGIHETVGAGRLVELDRDHPGFRDTDYRERRDQIARIAIDYESGEVPDAPYTDDEHAVWRTVWQQLGPQHERWAPHGYLVLNHRLGLDRDRIPQLAEVNGRLRRVTGFEMHPVAGLIDPRTFLTLLGENVFLATQYVRHHSEPFYTPEPDVIHELVGHAASFTHPMISELNRSFGRAAKVASESEMLALERVYWWTMEFGGLLENGEPKAFGAGLLSSIGELEHFATEAEHLAFDVAAMAQRDYDPTHYQPAVFVAPSWETMYFELANWLDDGGWRGH